MTHDESDKFNIASWLNEGTVEPSATHREWAKTIYGMYSALLQTGFNEVQALTLVCQTVKSSIEK